MHGDVVMEDSYAELETHWPIWRDAEGTVLVTGLGLGCVVRGLLNSPKVTHIDCVEIDPWIFQTIGKEFEGNSKVSLHLGDALRFKKRGRWDYAWHDIYTENGNGLPLAKLHTDLMFRVFGDKAKRQGAWNFPKEVSAKYGLIF
jgi:spermidine synthase